MLQLPRRHIVKTQPFTIAWMEKLFQQADALRANKDDPAQRRLLEGKILACLFYEPSTRTRLSFESAMHRLGGRVIGTENGSEFSSAAKGETLEDSIQVLNAYADAVVLRHTETNAAERAAAISTIPIISGGCGKGQHPTQALLDLYTIWRHRKGDLTGIRVALMGDLANGRTVRSLAYVLSKYKGVELFFVSPTVLRLSDDIRHHLREAGIKGKEYDSVDDIIELVDVLYVTRTQLERVSAEEREHVQGLYSLNGRHAQRMRKNAIIMHPLPRNGEISIEVDRHPRAVYLNEQIQCGLYIRMALLLDLLGKPQ